MSPAHFRNFDLIKPDPFISTHGSWSGSEGKNHKHFVAIIPQSRYEDNEEINDLLYNPFWKGKAITRKWDKSTGLSGAARKPKVS